jgi:PKD repeat protein
VERIMRSLGTPIVALLAVALGTASCTVKETEAPTLSGPSELALSLNVQANPDTVLQDGAAQSAITVDARGPNGQPVRNLSMRVDMRVGAVFADFGTLSTRTVVTGEDGMARFTYTAPPRPAETNPGTIVTLMVTPVGSDYRGSIQREVDIRVIPPGTILPPNGAPVPAFTFSPAAPTAFQTVFFDASGTTDEGVACGGRCSYTWSFGDGGSASGMNVTHEFRASGSYTVALRVTDERGQSVQTSQAVTVEKSAAPSAEFEFSPASPRYGQQIFFTAEKSRAPEGRHIVSYDWNFGSGRTGNGVTIAKQYDTPGTYTVTLTVTDDAFQQTTVSKPVTVSP